MLILAGLFTFAAHLKFRAITLQQILSRLNAIERRLEACKDPEE